MKIWVFLKRSLKLVVSGSRGYYLWMAFLAMVVAVGAYAYSIQAREGLIVTAMRDEVSWGLYIANFTFLVGVAAAAVLLVIPAYVYNFKAIKDIVIIGEFLAVSAIVMCLLFVTLDLGHPERFLHLIPIPGIGMLNFPASMLSWDIIVLNGYLLLNLVIPVYLLYRLYMGKDPNWMWALPLILLSIPWAVSIHTVTAFLYNALPGRPFWNASIMAPRFLASAFCSGPAFIIIIFQIVRKVTKIKIDNEAIFKLGEIITVAMFLNLFLLGAEIFKEFYSGTIHLAPMQYLYQGLHGNNSLVPWIWTATVLNLTAFFLFLIPGTRKNFITLNMACVFIFVGVWIEKGMGLIIPGFIPGVLGEFYYQYSPSTVELLVTAGVWAVGMTIFTLFLKVVIPIHVGDFRLAEGSSQTE
jgi:molybdopterin-containing oxidoreductase family membrane subunit